MKNEQIKNITEDVILGVQNNDPVASRIFMEAYGPYINICSYRTCNKFKILQPYYDEILSEAYSCLGHCLSGWKPQEGNFEHYFNRSLKNSMLAFYRKRKNDAKNVATSLDAPAFQSNEIRKEELIGKEDLMIRGSYDAKIKRLEIQEKFDSKLSKLERDIFSEYMADKSFREIAAKHRITEKNARYLYEKAKKILLND